MVTRTESLRAHPVSPVAPSPTLDAANTQWRPRTSTKMIAHRS